MLRIAVCDDEASVCCQIKEMLERVMGDCQITLFSSAFPLVSGKINYDLIFLDITMEGMDGIEAGRLIRQKDKQVFLVYVTNLDDYEKYALGVHAFSYLKKPVTQERLAGVLREVKEYRAYVPEAERRIEIMSTEGRIRITPRDILFCEYDSRKVLLHTVNGVVVCRSRIGQMAELLQPYDFSVPHKSFCVNLYHVKSLKGSEIVMTDGSMVPLSQKKAAAFRETMNIYLQGRIR